MTKGSPLEVTPRSTGSLSLWQGLGETEVAHRSHWQKLAHFKWVNYIWGSGENGELTKSGVNKANAASLQACNHPGMSKAGPVWSGGPVACVDSHFICTSTSLWVGTVNDLRGSQQDCHEVDPDNNKRASKDFRSCLGHLVFETGSCCLARAGLELTFWFYHLCAGIIVTHHHNWLSWSFCLLEDMYFIQFFEVFFFFFRLLQPLLHQSFVSLTLVA